MDSALLPTAQPPQADDLLCPEQAVHLDPAGPESPKPHSLSDLGYETQTYPRKNHTEQWHFIRQPGSDRYIAILMIRTSGPSSTDTLLVNTVDMDLDTRPTPQRPRLRQLLAAFWTSAPVSRDLHLLHRVVFRNVTERYTRAAVRDRLCWLVGVGYDTKGDRPHEDIVLEAPDRGGAREPWEVLWRGSRLAGAAVGMVRDCPGMALCGEERMVVQMRVVPACDEAGRAHCFDLEIVFGQRKVSMVEG